MVPMGPGMGHPVPHGQPQSGPVANAFSALNPNNKAAAVVSWHTKCFSIYL